MKKILLATLLTLINFSLSFAQAPSGYYDGTEGLNGEALKTKLSQIITNGHQDHGYGGLWNAYQSTDIDGQYENDGTILDYYSENPNGTDPYNFNPGANQCGSYSSEGDCYNREHIVPQSFFNSSSPMRNDIHHVRATDGKVNGMRGNYPFGEVNNPSWTSLNGSKVGTSSSAGYFGTVFEPIDEFKGDIARMVFYFITRYENQLGQFYNNGNADNMLGATAYPGLQTWELNVLLAWHNQDPVSSYEIARNNASYTYQGNRNPYIDNPQWVNLVWNPTPDTENPTSPTNLTANTITANSIDISWTASTDNVGVVLYEIYVDGVLYSTVAGNITNTTINGLDAETTYQIYIKAKDAADNYSENSNTISATTLATNSGGGNSATCGTEDFENIPSSSSSYSTRNWSNNGISWTATNTRTDQSLNNRAIAIKSGGNLTSSTISNGIGSLTITTKRIFSGGSGNLTLKVNNTNVGSIPYSATETTTTLDNLNIEGDITITIDNNSGDRVMLDDLSWTCYDANMGTHEVNAQSGINFYPNPVTDGKIYYQGENAQSIEWIKIYTSTGRLLKTLQNPFKKENVINVNDLKQGVYLIQTPKSVTKFIIR